MSNNGMAGRKPRHHHCASRNFDMAAMQAEMDSLEESHTKGVRVKGSHSKHRDSDWNDSPNYKRGENFAKGSARERKKRGPDQQ